MDKTFIAFIGTLCIVAAPPGRVHSILPLTGERDKHNPPDISSNDSIF